MKRKLAEFVIKILGRYGERTFQLRIKIITWAYGPQSNRPLWDLD